MGSPKTISPKPSFVQVKVNDPDLHKWVNIQARRRPGIPAPPSRRAPPCRATRRVSFQGAPEQGAAAPIVR
jgi:hypothetical protein